jgi:hypothetical protein
MFAFDLLLSRYANQLAILLTAIAIGVAGSIIMPLFRQPLDVKGKVCPPLFLRGTSRMLGGLS